MPSQRLLKILDPLGHAREPVPGGTLTAVVWAPAPALATVLRNRLTAAQIHPLMATAFRHVASSLMPGARPQADLVVLDLDATSLDDLSTLASMRWAGFTGPIIGINSSGQVEPAMRELYQLEAVLPRRRLSTALHELLARLPRRGT